MDRISKARRSAIMSQIRGTGNKRTEIDVIRLLRASRIKGWRRHLTISLRKAHGVASDGTLFKPRVRPDFTFPKSKLALFIDGCFWHGCPKCYRNPKSRKKFWSGKVLRNKERDSFQTRSLKQCRWQVIRMWECRLNSRTFLKLAKRISCRRKTM